MQQLEVSVAVGHIYIYIYIYICVCVCVCVCVIRRIKVKVITISIYVTRVKFYGLDGRGSTLWQGQEIFLIPKISMWALGPPSLLLVLLPKE